MKEENMKEENIEWVPNSNAEGIECPHCGHWNTHEECGTYQTLYPCCIKCREFTEVPP